jgi:hypothetical protein
VGIVRALLEAHPRSTRDAVPQNLVLAAVETVIAPSEDQGRDPDLSELGGDIPVLASARRVPVVPILHGLGNGKVRPRDGSLQEVGPRVDAANVAQIEDPPRRLVGGIIGRARCLVFSEGFRNFRRESVVGALLDRPGRPAAGKGAVQNETGEPSGWVRAYSSVRAPP